MSSFKHIFALLLAIALFIGYSANSIASVCAHDAVASATHDVHSSHDEQSKEPAEDCHSNCGPCHVHCLGLLQIIDAPVLSVGSQMVTSSIVHVTKIASAPPFKPNWP